MFDKERTSDVDYEKENKVLARKLFITKNIDEEKKTTALKYYYAEIMKKDQERLK